MQTHVPLTGRVEIPPTRPGGPPRVVDLASVDDGHRATMAALAGSWAAAGQPHAIAETIDQMSRWDLADDLAAAAAEALAADVRRIVTGLDGARRDIVEAWLRRAVDRWADATRRIDDLAADLASSPWPAHATEAAR